MKTRARGLTEILEAIALTAAPSVVQHRAWHRRLRALETCTVCAFCLAPLALGKPREAVIDLLVPVLLGGPVLDSNRVLSCVSCARSRGNLDLLGWQAFASLGSETSRQALLDQRLKVLARSLNHLPHTRAGAPMAAVLRNLETRWAQPRFTVGAVSENDVAWIGWPASLGSREALGQAAALLRFSFQATPVASGKLVLYQLPAHHFLDAIWALIDMHALVRPLSVPGLSSVVHPLENWQAHWPLHLEHLSDLRRRRARAPSNNVRTRGTPANIRRRFLVHGIVPDPASLITLPTPLPAPAPPRIVSTSPAAIKKRQHRKSQSAANRRHQFLEARASLDAFKERVRRGNVAAPSAQEMDWMERELLALLP